MVISLSRRTALLLAAFLFPAGLSAWAASRVPVAFQAEDGVVVRGWVWPGGRAAVILSHMFGTDQSVWTDLAGLLAARGYTVLTYDFRGVGRSGGRLVIAEVDRDVLAAIRHVRGRGARRVVLIGASMGGTASLVAAARAPVHGVVVMASGTQFAGLNARPHLPGLRVPKLFIVGSGDQPFHDSARYMHRVTPPPKHLLVLPTPAHGTYMLRTRHRAAIEAAILDFLKRYAGS
ncbi:MAG: alpha/beta fold hydrolase [Armatimonadota bacterium]|nr:alpha/beta fold hydrolase [Armatimonadota bacterium]MDR7561848.1 alpha/beta fold hydrolase [Armatimonadota bacterium]MDR7586991.1 alpha/beta fold hydrolase [Armatimonadota bacterium]MDR7612384.1 alpha/beta fold hydrolase [Armatimonadota bacterium]